MLPVEQAWERETAVWTSEADIRLREYLHPSRNIPAGIGSHEACATAACGRQAVVGLEPELSWEA